MQLVHESRPAPRHYSYWRMPDVESTTGLKKSTIYLLMKRGEFPRCVQITPRCVAWKSSDVLQWMDERAAAAGQASKAGAP